jgi:hypothetical protein
VRRYPIVLTIDEVVNLRPTVAARLRADAHELEQAKEAIKHLQAGRPLGELVGKQTLWNQALEIERLQMEVASLKSPQPGAEQNYYFMLQGAKHEIAQLKAQLAELHGKIMNLTVSAPASEMPVSWDSGYCEGVEDFRHAAAELCAGMGSMDVKGGKENG